MRQCPKPSHWLTCWYIIPEHWLFRQHAATHSSKPSVALDAQEGAVLEQPAGLMDLFKGLGFVAPQLARSWPAMP